MSTPAPSQNRKDVILFDGDCVLCNGWARFVAARDPARRFLLGTLQSDVGQRLLREAGITSVLSSIVLITPGGAWQKSNAVLRILARLSAPWPLLAAFRVIPRPVRDVVYDFIAQNRYRWFGKMPDQCPIPPPELRARLLEADAGS